MTTYIGLLRGVNLAGHKKVAMSDLRTLLAALGFEEPRTLLQSGNMVFRGATRPAADLERLLEVETERRLGVRTEYHVRTSVEWQEVVARNPFTSQASRDPAHLLVLCLKQAPPAGAGGALQAIVTGPERVHVDGRHAYIVYPDGVGGSRLTTAMLDRALGRGTGRNWNTVLKLALLAPGRE
ncbi:MAG TPA: DUF1697 domain-containing protein [Vicinamibacterales bacterium]|jgi:uncharacterized protein (DUF1697 family)